MRSKGIVLVLVGVMAATSAHAGTVGFFGPTDILPGTPAAQYSVVVDSSDLTGFDTISMTIGSPDGFGLSFDYDPLFLAQTRAPTTVPGPVGIYGALVPGATDVGLTAYRGLGPLWNAPVLVGTLTVDFTSLIPGDAPFIGIDSAFEVASLGSAVSLLANGPNQELLSGSVIFFVPEPATLGLLALGGLATALRRRKA